MKMHSPSASRNVQPILEVLEQVLPSSGTVLEIASGTGQHAAHFCSALPSLDWQASDRDPDSLPSIEAWRNESGLPNYLSPIVLDVISPTWPIAAADAVFCANMIHISPWESTLGLLAGAARILAKGAPLVLYGPYLEQEQPTAQGNLNFDASLRNRNPSWGIRNLADVKEVAADAGFRWEKRFAMPANNLCVVFKKK